MGANTEEETLFICSYPPNMACAHHDKESGLILIPRNMYIIWAVKTMSVCLGLYTLPCYIVGLSWISIMYQLSRFLTLGTTRFGELCQDPCNIHNPNALPSMAFYYPWLQGILKIICTNLLPTPPPPHWWQHCVKMFWSIFLYSQERK